MTVIMPTLGCRDVPNIPNIGFCRVEFPLDLLFSGRFDTSGVGELDSVVTMDVVVLDVVLKYVHHLASADEVVDAVFDLLW